MDDDVPIDAELLEVNVDTGIVIFKSEDDYYQHLYIADLNSGFGGVQDVPKF